MKTHDIAYLVWKLRRCRLDCSFSNIKESCTPFLVIRAACRSSALVVKDFTGPSGIFR